MKMREVCNCGGSFEVGGGAENTNLAIAEARSWRTEHNHLPKKPVSDVDPKSGAPSVTENAFGFGKPQQWSSNRDWESR